MKKIFILTFAILMIMPLTFGNGLREVSGAATGPESVVLHTPPNSPSSQISLDTARAGWEWWDGPIEYTNIIGVTGLPELGFGTFVSYYVNQDIGFPYVNSVYYIAIGVHGIGIPQAGGMYAYLTFVLPPNTNLAISSETPIICYGGELPLQQANCNFTLQQMYPGVNQYLIPSGEYGNVWPVASGSGWEFLIPVKTTTTLNNSTLMGEVTNVDGYQVPPKLYPSVPIYVSEGPTLLPPGAFNKYLPLNNATEVDIYPVLSWYESLGATSYYYCIDTTNDNNCTNWTYETVAVDELLPGTKYYWQIKAVNNTGTTYADGSLSAFRSFTTKTLAQLHPPGAFNKSAPTNGATGVSLEPTLSWSTASSNAEIHEYCYDTSNDNACTSWIPIGKDKTSVTLSGLRSDQTYYWHVRARNYDGTTYSNGSSVAFWSFKTTKSTAAPENFNKISPANNETLTTSNPTLSWGGIDNVNAYEYCYDTSNDNVCSNWIDNGILPNKTLSNLLLDTTYYWQVRAKNAFGTTYADGSPTAFWSFKKIVPLSTDDGVVAIAVQADGKILIGGYFEKVNGVTHNHIARLNADGSLDTSFNPNIDKRVDAIAVLPDGKILVGGNFNQVNGNTRNYIAKLNSNGTLDTTFNPNANYPVWAILLQPDDRILIGGEFTAIDGVPRNRIARLNKNGTLDSSFNPSLDKPVRTLGIQSDGKILIGGIFTKVNTIDQKYIARLNVNGSLDSTFNPILDNYLMNLVLQPDGKILVGGNFTKINNESVGHIARLDKSGELDNDFQAQANDSITSITLQADGKMIVGGYFTKINSETHNHVVRLDSKGNVDHSIYLDANYLVTCTGLQPNGTIIIGGLFQQVNGEEQKYVARLVNNLPATQSLSLTHDPNGASITLRLQNASPQVHRVTFAYSLDGIIYTSLGQGKYVMGNWVLEEQSLPAEQDVWIRARGYFNAGQFNGSGSILEKVRIFKPNAIYLPLFLR